MKYHYSHDISGTLHRVCKDTLRHYYIEEFLNIVDHIDMANIQYHYRSRKNFVYIDCIEVLSRLPYNDTVQSLDHIVYCLIPRGHSRTL